MELEDRLSWGDIVRNVIFIAIAIAAIFSVAFILWLILALISWIEATLGAIAAIIAVVLLLAAVIRLPSIGGRNRRSFSVR